MASNLIVARGGVEHVPPISLAFWRWFFVFLLLALYGITLWIRTYSFKSMIISTIGFVVMKADDQSKINIIGKIFTISGF